MKQELTIKNPSLFVYDLITECLMLSVSRYNHVFLLDLKVPKNTRRLHLCVGDLKLVYFTEQT